MEGFRNQAIVEKQLLAMGMSHFDVAVRRYNGKISAQHDDLLLAQIKDLCAWLHDQNIKNHEILVRPHGEHGVALISGLSHAQVKAFRVAGFNPAVLTEFAKDRYQVWLKHDRKLPRDAAESAIHYLLECAGAAPQESHWDSFGYLAGFAAQGAEGGAPFMVQLVESSGAVYLKAGEIGERFAPRPQ